MKNKLPDLETIIKEANNRPLSNRHKHLTMSAKERTKYIQGRVDGALWLKKLILENLE